MKIDAKVKKIAKFVEDCGLEVVGSCGGHKNAKFYQANEGEFYVDFIGTKEKVLYFSEFISEIEEDCEKSSLKVLIKYTAMGDLYFRLEGKIEEIKPYSEVY
jgi:hypothetical protein